MSGYAISKNRVQVDELLFMQIRWCFPSFYKVSFFHLIFPVDSFWYWWQRQLKLFPCLNYFFHKVNSSHCIGELLTADNTLILSWCAFCVGTRRRRIVETQEIQEHNTLYFLQPEEHTLITWRWQLRPDRDRLNLPELKYTGNSRTIN